ncbi:MAG: HipA domain-containing protein [Spirochaetes bacterium]|nr:HipA domain-containing protein [Spirochaetota bacterium]
MKRCPITYLICNNNRYSKEGLKRISRNINDLEDFPYTSEEQRLEAVQRASKMSIQGVQPKISAIFNNKKETFEIVDIGGIYIIKPQSHLYKELPENEDLTMKLANAAGINVPFHGLMYSSDNSLSYFIKRFDRINRKNKLHVEDFAQLAGKTRDTKYDFSMEKVVNIIDKYCTFPAIERMRLLKLTIFNFLIGNEDMHLKNYSLIKKEEKTELSPAYDLINTSIAMKNPVEEIALSIDGKKRNLTKSILFKYFAIERLKLNDKMITQILDQFKKVKKEWENTISISFLTANNKSRYKELLFIRQRRLGFE